MVKEPETLHKPVPLQDGPYRFTVEQFHKMGEAGIFPPDVKLELMDGQIIPMSIGKDHAKVVKRLNRKLSRLLPENAATLSIQDPLTVDDGSEPLPDVMMLEFREDDYAQRLPIPAEVLLLIEVSDSTLVYDRESKIPKYARNNIPESWVIDINGEKIWVYCQPSPDGYLQIQAYGRGENVRVLGLELPVAEILGEKGSEEA